MPTGRYKRKSLQQRFYEAIEGKKNGCWVWKRGRAKNGYGEITDQGRTLYAHRVSWEIHNGPIPEGMYVLHNCPGGDNKACVNPKHLWLGTQQDNATDAASKGQLATGDRNGRRKHPERYLATIPRGEKNGKSKLSNIDRAMIPQLSRTLSASNIAEMFGVATNTIYGVLYRAGTSVSSEKRQAMREAATRKLTEG